MPYLLKFPVQERKKGQISSLVPTYIRINFSLNISTQKINPKSKTYINQQTYIPKYKHTYQNTKARKKWTQEFRCQPFCEFCPAHFKNTGKILPHMETSFLVVKLNA